MLIILKLPEERLWEYPPFVVLQRENHQQNYFQTLFCREPFHSQNFSEQF
jgi:hypothetical protein